MANRHSSLPGNPSPHSTSQLSREVLQLHLDNLHMSTAGSRQKLAHRLGLSQHSSGRSSSRQSATSTGPVPRVRMRCRQTKPNPETPHGNEATPSSNSANDSDANLAAEDDEDQPSQRNSHSEHADTPDQCSQ